MFKVQCALFMQDCLCFEINCSFLSIFVIFVKHQANFQELGTIDGKQIHNLLGTFSFIMDATTILLNIYNSLIGLFYFWFCLVLLLISGWGPMAHVSPWRLWGVGGVILVFFNMDGQKILQAFILQGHSFQAFENDIGFHPHFFNSGDKTFEKFDTLTGGHILQCTIIPRLCNGIMFCFHHGHSVFTVGMMKNIKHHTLQRLH